MRLLRRYGYLPASRVLIKNAQKLRDRQRASLQLLQPLKSKTDSNLLNLSLQQLSKRQGEQVFNTFATRSLVKPVKSLNSLADVNVSQALKRKPIGIPFTVKDHLKVRGFIETCGFSDNLQQSEQNSDVVQLLEQAGCIPYAKTNVPQGILGIESNNPVYGLTANPYNQHFVSGGSSGGEGAHVAVAASAFGIASDSAGSARIPAAFCGVVGFKPTGSKRLSTKGRVGASGKEGIKVGELDSSFGFITRRVSDTEWLCARTIGRKTTASGPHLYGGVWDHEKYQRSKERRLRVGVISQYGDMKLAFGVTNTLNQTRALMERDGHTTVDFQFPQLLAFRDFFFQTVHCTYFLESAINRMKHDVPSPQATLFSDIATYGRTGSFIRKQLSNDEQQRALYDLFLGGKGSIDFILLQARAAELRKRFLQEWARRNLDVILSPTMPFTAPLKGTTKYLVFQLGFCVFQNVLELPAGCIPTRLVKPEETIYRGQRFYERIAQPGIQASAGLPLSVQLTGQHLRDQECLGALWQLERLVDSSIRPPQL